MLIEINGPEYSGVGIALCGHRLWYNRLYCVAKKWLILWIVKKIAVATMCNEAKGFKFLGKKKKSKTKNILFLFVLTFCPH